MEGTYFNGPADYYTIWDKDKDCFTGDEFYDLDSAEKWVMENGGFERYSVYLKIE